MSRDELAARLLVTFLGELDEQVGIMNAELLALEAAPGDAARLRSLFRVLHTLKGAARVAGVPLIEQLCHLLEAELSELREGRGHLDAGQFRTLYAAADAMADAGPRIRAGAELGEAPIAAILDELMAADPADPAALAAAPDGHATAAPPSARATAGEPSTPSALPEGVIRVQLEELDSLLASAGDLLITSGQIAGRPAGVDELHSRLNRVTAGWRRLEPRLRLVLDRAGAEAPLAEQVEGLAGELRDAMREAATLARDTARDARNLSRVTEEVAETVHRLRLRPFADACQALPRAVRDVAVLSGRLVELELAGQEVRVDRAVVDALREPLLHLVRNAVDHGIKAPEERRAAGKPVQGTVRVEAALRNGRLIVHVSDDGAGLDIPAIRARLEERGLDIAPGEREIVRALFAGGLSTREEVTAISGRGVGLDVVRATLERIGGSVDATWSPGEGTTFILECPPTPARIRALLVGVGAQVLAIPTAHVERLRRIAPDEIRYVEGRPVLMHDDSPVPFGSLAAILGPPLAPRPIGDHAPVILLRGGEHRLAVTVDQLLSEQELVFRPLERGRSALPHISGGALLPTGQTALVLNPAGIIAAGLGQATSVEVLPASVAATPARRRVLVVDDSITTRTLEESVLEAAGYEVLTAVDGAAAWQLLQEQAVDLVVADVEMPRLDGFGLCEAIRASKRYGELPVILVTALETQEHRARGLEAGADAYLAKSSFDQDTLLETIRQLLGGPGG
jgi:two-component system chemotaxis sensor kinase CheA